MSSFPDQRAILATIIARFPETFGLRAFPGETFRLSLDASYFPRLLDRDESLALLYTQRLVGGQWLCFAKGTIAELSREIIAAPNETK